ncbi:MAG: hypothetical protein FJW39_31575 [Acidobacteria bacterium]|nr:hypothetical protein [Acidobacteriota bacterium]
MSPECQWIGSVCTGSLILGAAGLLRGFRATSHWLSRDQLPYFGATPVEERVVIDRNRITAAGSAPENCHRIIDGPCGSLCARQSSRGKQPRARRCLQRRRWRWESAVSAVLWKPVPYPGGERSRR